VPATATGIKAIQQLICDGININATLLFSLQRYREVAQTCLSGLEMRVLHGEPLTSIASDASFFLSRINTLWIANWMLWHLEHDNTWSGGYCISAPGISGIQTTFFQ